jgi:hypothetical protein
MLGATVAQKQSQTGRLENAALCDACIMWIRLNQTGCDRMFGE